MKTGKETQFKKGRSGNPNGRPKDIFGEMVRAKKDLPETILKKMLQLMNSEDEDMQFKASAFLKESGWGKAAQPLDQSITIEKTPSEIEAENKRFDRLNKYIAELIAVANVSK